MEVLYRVNQPSRVDKKFYRPAIIRKWAIIIYETQQRFNAAAADRLVKDLVRGARARGACGSVNKRNEPNASAKG